jgi:hypothetical protein
MACNRDIFTLPYHKAGNEFLYLTVQVPGDESWVSFVKVETTEQSKQWMHTHSPHKPKKFKQTISASGNWFPGQERDGGIHATRDHIHI